MRRVDHAGERLYLVRLPSQDVLVGKTTEFDLHLLGVIKIGPVCWVVESEE